MLFATESADVSNWAQVIIQLGALGILGVVVYFAPPWIKGMLDATAKERSEMLIAYRAERAETLAAFRCEQAEARSADKDRTAVLVAAIDKQTESTNRKLDEVKQSMLSACKNS